MSFLKSIVKTIAATLPQEDLKALVAPRTVAERSVDTIDFLTRVAPLAIDNKAHAAVVETAQTFLAQNHGTTDFTTMCRKITTKFANPHYHAVGAIGHLIEAHYVEAGVGRIESGNLANNFIDAVSVKLDAAKAENNFIKRRSIVREAVKTELPGISSDRAAALTELLLLLR